MTDIIIYGKGKTGKSLLKMLSRQGKNAVLYDDESGFDGQGAFTSNSVVLLSPGVPPNALGIVQAKKVGAKILGELEYCFPFCKGKVISVTGTNGKTTTCEMIRHILSFDCKPNRLLGNGGVPFSSQVLDVTADELAVLESSSFQLCGAQTFSPYISVFTNLACDHLNYHGNFLSYAEAKANNFLHQRCGYAVFNADDSQVKALSSQCGCDRLYYSVSDSSADCYMADGKIVLKINGKYIAVAAEHIKDYAEHNRSNALAAILVCAIAGVKPDVSVEALASYKLLPHRMQVVKTFKNVTFVDDSKATNAHATVSALRNFTEPLALIMGGSRKGEKFDDIFVSMGKNVLTVAASGETAKEIAACGKKYGVIVEEFCDIALATEHCLRVIDGVGGGVVLMSNACASFDRFSGYAERGEYFCKVVERLCRG